MLIVIIQLKEKWIMNLLLFAIFCNIITSSYARYSIGSNLINEFADDIKTLVRTFSKVCILNKRITCNAPLVSAVQSFFFITFLQYILPQLVLCTAKLFIRDKVTYRQE